MQIINNKKIAVLIQLLFFIVGASVSQAAEKYRLEIQPQTQTIKVGEAAPYKLVKVYETNAVVDFLFGNHWEIVKSSQLVGKKPGTIDVSLSFQGRSASGKVVVEPADPEPTYTISLVPNSQEIEVGQWASYKLIKSQDQGFIERMLMAPRQEVLGEASFEGTKPGEFTVSKWHEGKTYSADVIVKELEKFDLIMSPPHHTLTVGQSVKFDLIKVTGPGGARKHTVVDKVYFAGGEQGTFQVEGSYKGKSATATVTVGVPTYPGGMDFTYSLYIEPRHQTIEVGQTAVYRVFKTERPQSNMDYFLPNEHEPVDTVKYTGTTEGTFKVYGHYRHAVITADVTVVAPLLTITPEHRTIKVGETAHFQIMRNSTVNGNPFSEVIKTVTFEGVSPGEFKVVESVDGRTLQASVTVEEKDNGFGDTDEDYVLTQSDDADRSYLDLTNGEFDQLHDYWSLEQYDAEQIAELLENAYQEDILPEDIQNITPEKLAQYQQSQYRPPRSGTRGVNRNQQLRNERVRNFWTMVGVISAINAIRNHGGRRPPSRPYSSGGSCGNCRPFRSPIL